MSAFDDQNFLEALTQAGIDGQSDIDLLVSSMTPRRAHLLRVCSILHYCDRRLLESMLPSWEPVFLVSEWNALKSLGITEAVESIVGDGKTFCIHARYRRTLFSGWLTGNRAEFSDLNQRTASYWQAILTSDPYEKDRIKREQVFHEFCAAPWDGIARLEQTCSSFLERNQPGDSAATLAYARELDPILDSYLRSRILILEGDTQAVLGHKEQARLKYEQALHEKELGSEVRITTMLRLADIDLQAGLVARSEGLYRDALFASASEYGESGRATIASASIGLARLLRETKRLDEARAVLENAITPEFSDNDNARVRFELALVRRDQGNFNAAVGDLQTALMEISRSAPTRLEAEIRRELGLAFECIADWSRAEDALRSSLVLFGRSGDTMARARVLTDLARVLWRQRNLSSAARLAGEAGNEFLRVRANTHAGLAQLQAARVLTELREKPEARRAYELAARLLKDSGATGLIAAVNEELNNLTRTRRFIGYAASAIGLSSLAGFIGLMEVEHLYLGIGSFFVLVGAIGVQLQRLAEALGDRVVSWSIGDLSAMQLFFLASWSLAVAVPLLPLVYFLLFGWRARQAEFIDKVRVGSHTMTGRMGSVGSQGALHPMEEYFRKFWSVGRDEYCRTHKGVNKTEYAKLFEARYSSLIGRRHYLLPSVLFLLVVSILSGLVLATAVRSGYDTYIAYYVNEAKLEAGLPTAAPTIGNPITIKRINITTMDADFFPLPPLQLSLSALSAIAGAYLFVVAQLIQQCRARTLVYSDLFGASLRLLVAVPLGLSLSVLASESLGPFISFALGAFPIRVVGVLLRRLTVTILKVDDPRAEDDQTVAMLGVTQSVSDVLAQENITCAQQLTDIDPVVLAVRTGLSFDYVLFLVAQSLVWCFLGKTASILGPLGYSDARAIWYLMNQTDEKMRAEVLRSLDAHFAALSTKDTPKCIDDVLLRQAFKKISEDPYTIFLFHFTTDLDRHNSTVHQKYAVDAEGV